MPTAWLNHVSISAEDLAESTRFYTEVFGAETIPTPNFGFPVQWLRLGHLQLHLFQRPEHSAPRYHHIAFAVDDFEGVFRTAKERGIHDHSTFGHHLYELSGNIAQMYIRDPGGNLVEVNWPDARGLDASIRGEMWKLSEVFPQSPENLKAVLYLERRCAVTCGQSVRFTAGSEGISLSVGRQSRSIAARSPRQPAPAAGSRHPASRLIGSSPTGVGSSGEGTAGRPQRL